MTLLQREAEQCRRQAGRFTGKPEAPFLLRLASAFEELAHVQCQEKAER